MSFRFGWKKICLALLVAVPLLSQVACERFLQTPQNESEDKPHEVKQDRFACLGQIPTNLKMFLNDEGGAPILTEGTSCLQASLRTFMEQTQGNQADSYTGKELQYFLNKYFLKENKISDEFQKEIMKLKVLMVGGVIDRVTRAELNEIIEFIDVIRIELTKLQGKIRFLFFRQDQNTVSAVQVQETRKTLQEVSARLLDKMKISGSFYQWADFVSFLDGVKTFLGESDSFSDVLKWAPLVGSLKALLLAEDNRILTERQWAQSVRWVMEIYGLALQFHYEIKPHDLDRSQPWPAVLRWVDEVIATLENAPLMKEKKLLEAQVIDRVIDEVIELKLFDISSPASTFKNAYRKVLVHLIEGIPGGKAPGSGDPESVQGFSERHLRIFKQEYLVWKLNQNFLIELFNQNPIVTQDLMAKKAMKVEPKEKILKMTSNSTIQSELLRSWVDFIGLVNLQPPVMFNVHGKVVMGAEAKKQRLSFSGVKLINIIFSMTRLTLRGYGEHISKSPFGNRMAESGLAQFEEDFREVGQMLGFLDPRSIQAAKRTFLEANLFAYHGDGDLWMSPTEIFEELNILLSGGRNQVEQMMLDLRKGDSQGRTCLTGRTDIFGHEFVNEVCFLKVFKARLHEHLDHLPRMAEYISGLTEGGFAEFYENLHLLAKLPPKYHVTGQLEYSEIRNMMTVLHYIESLMTVYDQNSNMKLSEAELVMALPRFERLIRTVSPLGNYFVKDIFLFLVYKTKKPVQINKEVAAFLWDMKTGRLGEVDRMNLIKILGLFKKEVK